MVDVTAAINTKKNKMPNIDYYKKKILIKNKLNQNQAIKLVASETKQGPPLNVCPMGLKEGPEGEFPP